ncbi:small multi-drug export protein [Candidatus Woesearchaeota archaeon]|nr:small multi-drug export protein [Candidatus Woesearchaeota archaeon]
MLKELFWIIAFTFIPALELRASIPYGIFRTDLHWTIVFLVAVLANAFLGVLLYFLLDKVIHLFFFIPWFQKMYHKIVERSQKKIHAAVEKWGFWGFVIFIGIPLPGSGTYTAAVGAYALGMGYKRFILANFLGVLIAGIIVTILCLAGGSGFEIFIKKI